MNRNPFITSYLDPKVVIENITIKKILLHFPQYNRYKPQIKFNHVGNKASLNLELLPADVAKNIKDFLSGAIG